MNYRPIGTQLPLRDIPKDERPARGTWSPGHYLSFCQFCGAIYLGGIASNCCATCAYATPATCDDKGSKCD